LITGRYVGVNLEFLFVTSVGELVDLTTIVAHKMGSGRTKREGASRAPDRRARRAAT